MYYGSVLLISELPEDGYTEEDIIKIFQPFGKVNDVLIVPYRKEVSHLVCSDSTYIVIALCWPLLDLLVAFTTYMHKLLIESYKNIWTQMNKFQNTVLYTLEQGLADNRGLGSRGLFRLCMP